MIHHAESRIPLMLTAVMGPGHDRGSALTCEQDSRTCCRDWTNGKGLPEHTA